MILYHRTTARRAAAILRKGFRDGKGRYLTDRLWKGVWLSNVPLDANEGAAGDTLLKINLAIPARELREEYEWREEGKPYREFLIPSAIINARATVRRESVDSAAATREAYVARPERTAVRLVRRRDARHPYVIEVTIPGWRGIDTPLHEDLCQIGLVLRNAGVGTVEQVMLLNVDGTTEFLLEDAAAFETAAMALMRAGWLEPAMPPDSSVQ